MEDWVHLQPVFRLYQSEWCNWYAWGKRRWLWQSRDMHPCKPHEVPQGKVQGPANGLQEILVSVQTWWWPGWEQPCKGLRATGWLKKNTWAWVCDLEEERQLHSGLKQKQCGKQVKEADSAPLLHSGDPTWSVASSSGVCSTRNTWPLLVLLQRSATKIIKWLEHLSCEDRLRELR